MKLKIFDITKYNEALEKLKRRNAPSYVIEAYKMGFVDVVNEYYKLVLEQKRNKSLIIENSESMKKLAERSQFNFLKEARNSNDNKFIKAFFQMTNMDILSGGKLPPEAGALLKQGIAKDMSLKDLFKKMR